MKLQFKAIQFILFISILVISLNIPKVYAQEETVPVEIYFFNDTNNNGIKESYESYDSMDYVLIRTSEGNDVYEFTNYDYSDPVSTISLDLAPGEYTLWFNQITPSDDFHSNRYFNTESPYNLTVTSEDTTISKGISFQYYEDLLSGPVLSPISLTVFTDTNLDGSKNETENSSPPEGYFQIKSTINSWSKNSEIGIYTSNNPYETDLSIGDFNIVFHVTEDNYSPEFTGQNPIYRRNPPNNLGGPSPLIITAENMSAPQTTTLPNGLFTAEIGLYNQNNLYPVTITNFHDYNLDGIFDSNESFYDIYTNSIIGATNSGEIYDITDYSISLERAPIVVMLPAGQYTISTYPAVPSSDDLMLIATNDNPKVISIDGSQSSYDLEFGFNFEPTSVTLSDTSANQSTNVTNIFAFLSIIFLGLLSLLGLISLKTKKANLN